MDEIVRLFRQTQLFARQSPFLVIAIVVGIIFLLRLKFRRTSTDLIIQVLAMIIGVLVLYGILWYLDQIVIEP